MIIPWTIRLTSHQIRAFPIFSETPPAPVVQLWRLSLPCSRHKLLQQLKSTLAQLYDRHSRIPPAATANYVPQWSDTNTNTATRLDVTLHTPWPPAYTAQPRQLSTQRRIWNEPSLKVSDSHSHSCIKNINHPSPPPYYVCPYKWFVVIPQYIIHDGIADLRIF